MPEIEVIRYEVQKHRPFGDEEYDPSRDMLIVVHKNPEDPSDPTEFGHHMRLQGVSYRKEMWGSADYAEVIDQELKDLERFYFWDAQLHAGTHPLAAITEHYFTAPPARMQSFAPDYILDSAAPTALMPTSRDGQRRLAMDVVMTGLDDVRLCLGASSKKSFPCKGMTGLSTSSVTKRTDGNRRMSEETRKVKLKPGKAIDGLRQYLTDRSSELETSRKEFVDHVLVENAVPDLMLKRVEAAVARRTGKA